MVRGIASVLVYVRDMAASADFYGRLLGVPAEGGDATITQFSVGTLRLVLHRDRTTPARAGVAGAMEFDIEVGDIATFRSELAGRGIAAPEPRQQPWGWTGFSLHDPDGNVVEVYEIP